MTSEFIKSKEQKNSIDTALKQFDEGQRSLNIIENKEKYKIALETYTEKTKDKLAITG